MSLKKTGIVLGSIVVVIYALFLALPLCLNGLVNSYSDDISAMVEEASGFKLRLENLGLVTTPKLTIGIKAGHVGAALPSGEEFFNLDNGEFKISLLPLLLGKVEADVIKADSINAAIKVRPDGKLLLEEYLQKQENSEEETVSAPLTGLPFGFKLSNHLPDIRVKEYSFAVIDMQKNKSYSLNGKDFKVTDFILDKKVKLSTTGNIIMDDTVPFNYDIKIFNKVMPDLNLNDMVFAQNSSESVQSESVAFNIIDVLENIKTNQISADLITDIKIQGSLEDMHFDGLLDVENLTLAVNGQKLPKGHAKLNFIGKKLVSDIALYTAENELTSIIGEFTGGKSKKVKMAFKSNAQINNIFNIIKSLAASVNYNDLKTLSAKGGIDADFTLDSDMKKVVSGGYFKIPAASVNYALYNILIDKINADIDFSGDTVNIKNIGFTVLSHALNANGTIKNDSTTDLHLKTDKMLIKGLLTAAGQIGLLKDNDIKSGTISVDASVTGKLKEIKPVVDVVVDNVNILNKPSSTSVKIADSAIKLTSDGKSYNGQVSVNSVNVINPALTVKLPVINITLNEKDINIADTYLTLDNSRIDISGKISDYTAKNMAINILAKGNLLANDLRNMIPADLRGMFNAKGSMPLLVRVSGDAKKQIADIQLLATPSGYLHIMDVAALTSKSTMIRSNITIDGNSLKLTDTGIYSTAKTSIPEDGSLVGLTKLVSAAGKIKDFSNFDGFKVNTVSNQTVSIPGFNNSKAEVTADITLNGNLMTPSMKGNVNLPLLELPSIKTSLKNITANLGGDSISVNLPLITIDNSVMNANAIVSSNFANGLVIKSVDFNGNLIDADTLAAAMSGLSSGTTSASTAASDSKSSSAPADIGIVIQNGKGTVTKFKTGNITATGLTADFGLKNNVFYLKNLKGDAFSGKISGNINCNVVSGLTNVDMTASGMNAVDAIEASAGIPNALSGVLGFTAKLKLNAFASDFNAMMKSITGDITFDVKDGHYANIGRLDNLLLAQNLAANAILKAALAPIRNLPVVQNTSNFKTITGSLSLSNGIANLKSVKSAGPSMAYFVTGQYNLINGYTNVVILGRLGADVVAALGPLGELSVTKLTSYIPKFGTQTANILSALTSSPKSENIAQIPVLTNGSTNAKDFKVIFTGNVTSASSIKSFKWLSECDTSAITGGSLKEQIKTTTEALKTNHQNNVEAVKQSVNDVKEAAKNTAEDVKNQIQKTKDSIQELKNLFKKPAATESPDVAPAAVSE